MSKFIARTCPGLQHDQWGTYKEVTALRMLWVVRHKTRHPAFQNGHDMGLKGGDHSPCQLEG